MNKTCVDIYAYPPGIIKVYAEGDTNYPWYDSVPSNPDAYDLISPYGPGKVMPIIGPVKPAIPNVTDNYSVVGCAGGICDVQLDITGPQDPYGTAYTYTWTGAFGTATGAKPVVQLAAGTYQVSVAVSDPYATLVTATMLITVVDPNPPVIFNPPAGNNQGGGAGNAGNQVGTYNVGGNNQGGNGNAVGGVGQHNGNNQAGNNENGDTSDISNDSDQASSDSNKHDD